METIAAYTIFLIQLVGYGVHVGLRRHGLVESGVKDAHLRQARHQLLHSVHAFQVGGVVQRSQVGALLELLQHLVGQNDALVELLTAVYDAVSYSTDLTERTDDTDIRIKQVPDDRLDGFVVVRHRNFFRALGSALRRMCDAGSLTADALTQSLCEDFLRIAVDQLILER